MKETTVVNLRFQPYDIYIGRAGKGQDGTFGNPFCDLSREENIAKFKNYFHARIKSDLEFKNKVLTLRGKALGCFCKPNNACHGDIIAEYLNGLSCNAMKAGIVGSRSFIDYEYMKSILEWFNLKKVISGGARGADSLAKRYALENNIKYEEFLPDWDMHQKKAGFIRNLQIIEASDEIIAFWDGQSNGTRHTIETAKSKGKEVHIYWPAPSIDPIEELGF